jgi:hypothetical protein
MCAGYLVLLAGDVSLNPGPFTEIGNNEQCPSCLCDVTLSVYPHRAGLKNMPGHGGIRTYDLWFKSDSAKSTPFAVQVM